MIWLRKVGAETQGKNVSLPLMRELHGEWEKIPRAKVSNLVGEEPRALIKRTRFRVESSVGKGEESCEAIKIGRGTTNVVKAMPVGTKGTESVKKREPKFLSAREQEDAEPFATSEGNNVARHSFTGLCKKRGNLCGKVNGSGSPDADSFDCVRNGTICGESLGVGTGDVYNVGESGVWEELIDDFRVSREEVMDVKRRDGVRLRFNELVHMVFTGEGRDMSWEEHDSENASKKEVVQSGREVR